jgi:hypothetical protein
MKIYKKTDSGFVLLKYAITYLDIGHNPSQDSPVIIWWINNEFKFYYKKIYDAGIGHGSGFRYNHGISIAAGRFDISKNLTSLSFSEQNMIATDDSGTNERTKELVKEMIRNNFGNIRIVVVNV